MIPMPEPALAGFTAAGFGNGVFAAVLGERALDTDREIKPLVILLPE